MELLVLLIIMLVLLLIKMPVAFAVGFTAIIGLTMRGIPFELIPQRMWFSLNSFPLVAIPLFIFVGEVMNIGGVTRRLFAFCRTLARHFRGGLGHVNVLTSVAFSGMSGSAIADLAGLGVIQIKAMREAGYDDDFSAAISATSATLGPIKPPSIPLVIFAILADQSVGRLFLGGVVPGFIIVLSLMIAVHIFSVKRNYPREPRAKFPEIRTTFLAALPCLLTPIIILGGIFGGVVSVTEAAALACFWSLIVAMFIYRELDLKGLYKAIKRTIVSASTVLIIIASSSVLSWIVITSGAPQILSELLQDIVRHPLLLLLLINVILLIMGMFLEAMAVIMIMGPVLIPIVSNFGIDLVAFGVIFVLNCMISLCTPPFGLSLFIACRLIEKPMSYILRTMMIFVIPLLCTLLLITIFPGLITWLPNLVFGAVT